MNRIFSKNFLDEVNVVVSFLIWHLDWRTNRCVTNDDDHHLDFYRWPWIKKKMMGLRRVAASTCRSTSFFSWLDRFYFFLPTPNRPSRVNRIESVKETDVFSSKRLRKGEKRRCDSSFVTESIVGHVPSSSFPVWSRHMEMELFQPLNNTNQKLSSLFEKGKKEKKVELYFILFHYRRYDVTVWCVCVCPWVCKILRWNFFSFATNVRLRHGVISYLIISRTGLLPFRMPRASQ